MTHLWLNFHVHYACRHSGSCCTSGWPIPVERDRVISIRALAGRADDAWLIPVTNAPAEVAGTLALQHNGHCVFRGEGCGIHAVRPASCAHFPYVCLIDARGVRVALSHYCPTAASMLFEDAGPIAIVEGPPPVPEFAVPEGLDARESLPPTFAKATVGKPTAKATVGKPTSKATVGKSAGNPKTAKLRLMSWDEFDEWERGAIADSGVDADPPALALFERARAAVPAPWSWPVAPWPLTEAWPALIAPAWPRFSDVVQRYRAAKIFASWAAYQGDGLAAVVRLADIAGAVLKVEAVRACHEAGRALDADLLKRAIRQADLLLVHYADGRVLSSGTSA